MGTRISFSADYLVGCDGGSSPIRKQLGIKLRGEGGILELQQALFYCEELFDRLPNGQGPGQGRHYHRADDEHTFLDYARFHQALESTCLCRRQRCDET